MDHSKASSSHESGSLDRNTTPSSEKRVDFYSDFDSQSHRTVDIDQFSTTLQALQKLFSDEEIRSGHCAYWAIFEHRRSSCMYRTVEEHEILTRICDSWLQVHEDEGQQNRFVLKRDYCKYEVYRNPKQFFPDGMLNLSSEKFRSLAGEHPSAQNSFLRNLILSTNWHPEVEGSLYFRDKALFHSPTWKKLYFILRPSGLYSSKVESKDPKHLSLVCSLEHLNIYQHQNGKKLSAPTDYVICLSGLLDDKQHNTFLSCESEEMCRNWIVALRLQKFGKQLKDNYQSAAQADLMLNTTDNIKDLALQEKLKARVAMDFSGDCGRLVEDQQGAIEALVTEVQGWKKRRTGRGDSSADSTSPSLPLHLAQPWFHAALSREEATRLLAERGLVDGVFLIRRSRSQPRTSVLSVAHSGKVRHYHITRVTIEDNQVCLSLDGGKTKFADLMQLVDFYHLNTGSLCCKLRYPAKIVDKPS